MRLSSGLLLTISASLGWASVKAPFYILHEHELPNHSEAPILSSNEAKLVLVQRLGVSNNYDLSGVSETTLSHINKFGGHNSHLFESSDKKMADLLLVVEGIYSEAIQPLLNRWLSKKPDFQISDSSSFSMILRDSEFHRITEKLENSESLEIAMDTKKSQVPGNSKIIQLSLINKKDGWDILIEVLSDLRNLFERRKVNAAVLFIPKSSSPTESNLVQSETNEKIMITKRRDIEKSMLSSTFSLSSIDQLSASNVTKKPFKSMLPRCFNSLDTCTSLTKNCSGHGECISKSGERDKQGVCFTCKCRATNETLTWAKGSKKGWKIGYWGGSACHKEDVSSDFWLVSIFTIVMLGVTTWGISMLFSIGEESLPGVIGAGVPTGKPRQN